MTVHFDLGTLLVFLQAPPAGTESVLFSLAVVLEFCVFLYLQHFSFTFLLWVCNFLLLLSFATVFSCSVFLLLLFHVFLHHSCVCSLRPFSARLIFCCVFALVGHCTKHLEFLPWVNQFLLAQHDLLHPFLLHSACSVSMAA